MKTALVSMTLIALLGAQGNDAWAAATTKGKKGKKDEPAAATADTPAAKDQAAPAPSDTAKPAEQSPTATDAKDDHTLQMRGLEERVNDLKEKIFRSKARLMLLRETVLNGMIAGAKATIVHRNQMGGAFVLESASYALDGAPIYNKTDNSGDLSGKEQIELFNNSIVPGNHNLTVNLVYHGSGFGIFSYFAGYKFKIKSSYAFTAEEGKITTVKAVAYEKGGFTTDLKDRPALRYDVDVKADASSGPPSSGTPAEGASPAAAPAAEPGK
jgi:hypothetical protein